MSRARAPEKEAIRREVWDALEAGGLARFPFPPHGRIPNFAGAERAAARAMTLPPLATARRIKVNPDAPQRPLRRAALERGIEVYVPTPRLQGGFRLLDPQRIAPAERAKAVSLAGVERFGEVVPLDALPPMDALVVGSVAVSPDGGRLGKGEGYADIEYGILRTLGHPPAPVLTTVHATQCRDSLPRDPTDLPLAWIVTPDHAIPVAPPPPDPGPIDWSRLDAEDLEALPILAELRQRHPR